MESQPEIVKFIKEQRNKELKVLAYVAVGLFTILAGAGSWGALTLVDVSGELKSINTSLDNIKESVEKAATQEAHDALKDRVYRNERLIESLRK